MNGETEALVVAEVRAAMDRALKYKGKFARDELEYCRLLLDSLDAAEAEGVKP